MSKAVKSIFGGTDRSAMRANQAQNEQSRDFIQQQMGQSQGMLNQGFGGAYNVLQGAIPEQLGAFQQGNMAAQAYLLGGMPAFQGAVMGMPGQSFQMPPMAQVPFSTQFTQQPFPQQMQPQQQQQINPEFANPLRGRMY